MKKSSKLFLLLALVCTLLVCCMMSASAETEGIFTYTVTNDEATITGVEETFIGDIILPEEIGGYPVTSFQYIETMNDIYIHAGIKEIVDGEFWGFAGNFYVDENNPYFSSEDGVLYNKDKTELIKYPCADKAKRTYFEVPESVTKIAKGAFYFAAYLEEIKLNEGLKEIDYMAFGYTCINDIEFPSTLESIGGNAFCLSPMIDTFIIPENVKYIGGYALFTYLQTDIYFEGIDITFGEWEYFGFQDVEILVTREELADMWRYIIETGDFESFDDSVMINRDSPFSHAKYYCHEGANYIELMDTVAADNGVETFYEYTHFFKDWSYDWENYERAAKCIHCDETTTEALEKAEDTENEVEILAPAIPDAEFVVENIENEDDERYALVVESLESYEGPAEIEKIYDITLQNSENVAIQPDGSVQVKLPAENANENYKVFRVNDDGTYTDMNATVVDGYIVFVTDHFSLYVIVDTSEPHEHLYNEEITKPATHLEEGVKTYRCECGDSYTEAIEKDPKHHWELKYFAPTCTEDGYDLAKCACGDEFIYKTYVALNHDYDYKLNYSATHLKDGLETYTCSRCGYSYTNTLPRKTEHYYSYYTKTTEPTCTEQGYTLHKCECGDSYKDNYKPALGHTRSSHGDWCSRCGTSMAPAKPDTSKCSCNCHKTGFMGFIYKIALFFWKLFKTNKTCACGTVHY